MSQLEAWFWYLSKLLHIYGPYRPLRYSSDTCRLKTRGFRAFFHFGSHIWNTVPQGICSLPLDFPSKATSEHFSSMNASVEQYCFLFCPGGSFVCLFLTPTVRLVLYDVRMYPHPNDLRARLNNPSLFLSLSRIRPCDWAGASRKILLSAVLA